jgi:hypothetical protein
MTGLVIGVDADHSGGLSLRRLAAVEMFTAIVDAVDACPEQAEPAPVEDAPRVTRAQPLVRVSQQLQ